MDLVTLEHDNWKLWHLLPMRLEPLSWLTPFQKTLWAAATHASGYLTRYLERHDMWGLQKNVTRKFLPSRWQVAWLLHPLPLRDHDTYPLQDPTFLVASQPCHNSKASQRLHTEQFAALRCQVA